MVYKCKEGFSLVELLLTMMITSILLLGLIAIMSYGSRSMRATQAKVALQDQAKDVVNHISTYVMEGDADVFWDDTGKALTVIQTEVKNDNSDGKISKTKQAWVYWLKGGHIFFAKATDKDSTYNPGTATAGVDSTVLDEDMTCLLADHVNDFICKKEKKVSTGSGETAKWVLSVEVDMKDSISEFECKKDILMRNQ